LEIIPPVGTVREPLRFQPVEGAVVEVLVGHPDERFIADLVPHLFQDGIEDRRPGGCIEHATPERLRPRFVGRILDPEQTAVQMLLVAEIAR